MIGGDRECQQMLAIVCVGGCVCIVSCVQCVVCCLLSCVLCRAVCVVSVVICGLCVMYMCCVWARAVGRR